MAIFACLALLATSNAQAQNLSVLRGDSDGDGVFNTQELMWGTNMHSKDTDGDGFDDGKELEYGYDPRNPQWGARFLPVERLPQVKTAGLWVHGPSHLEGSVVAEDRLDVADELNAMGVATFGRGIVVAQSTTSNFGGTLHNSTITNGTDNPLTIGDNLRVDGMIWRWQQGEKDGKRVIIKDGLDVWDTLLVGGGYGATGLTVTPAGNTSMNGHLVVDGSGTFGGGYGKTGTTLDPAGNVSMNGNLQVDGTIQSGVSSILINGPQHNIRSSQALTVQTQTGQIVLFPQNSRVILKRGVGDRAAVGGIVGPAGREPLIQSGIVGEVMGKQVGNWGEIRFEKPYKIEKFASITITPMRDDIWNHQANGSFGPCTAYTVHITGPISNNDTLEGVTYQVRRIKNEDQVGGQTCDAFQGTNLIMEDVTGSRTAHGMADQVTIMWTAYGYE